MGRYFKKLVGELCYLSPVDPEDYLTYTAWLNDLEVTVGLNLLTHNVAAASEREALHRMSTSGHAYAIVDLETDQLIGNCGFQQVDHLNGTAGIGIFIGDKRYWNRGYGTEAMRLLLDFGFNVLNLHSVMLEVFSYNRRAIASYRKVGFREVGRWRESKAVGGARHDRVFMDILASELSGSRLSGLARCGDGGREE